MTGLFGAMVAAKRRGAFHEVVDAIPYAGFLGLRVETTGDGVVTILGYRDRNVGNAALPALHGGTIGALLECAGMFELIWRTDLVTLPRTVTLTIDYLRSARPVDTFGSATIVRHGRRVASVRVHAWQDARDQPIAAATVHFLLESRT